MHQCPCLIYLQSNRVWQEQSLKQRRYGEMQYAWQSYLLRKFSKKESSRRSEHRQVIWSRLPSMGKSRLCEQFWKVKIYLNVLFQKVKVQEKGSTPLILDIIFYLIQLYLKTWSQCRRRKYKKAYWSMIKCSIAGSQSSFTSITGVVLIIEYST